jgi:conjugative transfer signal peptidase TraF
MGLGLFVLAGVVAVLQWGHPMERLHILFNNTISEPLGFYRIGPVGKPHVGEVVTFCPNPYWDVIRLGKARGWLVSGACPGNLAPFIKTIVAVAGQTVQYSAKGVCLVGGACLPHSAPKARSWLGNTAIPHAPFGTYRIPRGKVWLYGTVSPWSLDSRYYGPVSVHRLRHSAKPLLTWK